MSIITNSCIAGYLYKDIFHMPYPHPFIWSKIRFDSFVTLLLHFNDIDFRNIKLHDMNHILIDNSVDVHYLHYVQNNSSKTPTYEPKSNTIQYNHIDEYIITKYNERLNRMTFSEPFIFMMGHSYEYLTREQLIRLNDLNISYRLFVWNDIVIPCSNHNISMIPVKTRNNNRALTIELMNYIKVNKVSTGNLS